MISGLFAFCSRQVIRIPRESSNQKSRRARQDAPISPKSPSTGGKKGDQENEFESDSEFCCFGHGCLFFIVRVRAGLELHERVQRWVPRGVRRRNEAVLRTAGPDSS